MSKKLLFNFNREVIQNYTYVKYVGTIITATNTLEKPIKSAILTGNTKYQIGEFIQDVQAHVQQFKVGCYLSHINGTLVQGGDELRYCEDYIPIPTGVTSITSKGSSCWKKLCCYNSDKKFISGVNGTVGLDDLTLNIPSNAKYFRYSTNTTNGENEYINVVSNNGLLLASSNYNIPCELVSVKMPVLTTQNTTNLFCVDELLPGIIIINNFNMKSTDFIPVEPREKLWFNLVDINTYTWAKFYTEDKTEIMQIQVAGHSGELGFYSKSSHVVPDDAKYMKVFVREDYINSMMVNRGNDYLPYEKGKPYKTNILTVNDNVELGSVGEVKDELNLLTGQLTQRTETRAYQEGDESNSEVITDMANTRYKLPKESIKTVDLSILDQNENKVSSISSFNDTTHITASSETIPPIFEGYIATKEVE